VHLDNHAWLEQRKLAFHDGYLLRWLRELLSFC
jgi:hypothetical protein